MINSKPLFLSILILFLSACQNKSTISDTTDNDIKAEQKIKSSYKCSAPPPVRDIWALEPMLIKDNLITADMDKVQKEKIIRDYIRKKNEFFEKCKGLK